MKRITTTDFLRVKLSISQQDVADFLGITRSQLSMYELNKRELPGKAIKKLAPIEIMHHNLLQGTWKPASSGVPNYRIEIHQQKIKRTMDKLLADANYIKPRLEKQLESKKAAYEKTAIWAQLVEHLLAETPDDPEHEGDLKWLNIQRDKIAEKEVLYGVATQAMIAAKIAVLETQVAVCKQVLENIG